MAASLCDAAIDMKAERVADQLQGSPRSTCVYVYGVDSSFMFTLWQRWTFEDEAVPVIIRTVCRVNIGAEFCSDVIVYKLPVDEKLKFNACARI